MKNNNQDSAQTPKELLGQLQALVIEAESLMSSSLSEHSEETLTNLRDRFAAARDGVAQMYEGAKNKIVAGAKRTDVIVRENPYQSIAVALGLGLLAGVLIGRRTK